VGNSVPGRAIFSGIEGQTLRLTLGFQDDISCAPKLSICIDNTHIAKGEEVD
jgi:hypothetical protein